MTKIGQAVLKLSDSTINLEIPPKNEGVLVNDTLKCKQCWNYRKAHPWTKPHQLIYNTWGRAPGVGCARSREPNIRKKLTATGNFTYIGWRVHLTNLYHTLHTWWPLLPNQLCQFRYWSIQRFLFCEELKMTISCTYAVRLPPITVKCATAPTCEKIIMSVSLFGTHDEPIEAYNLVLIIRNGIQLNNEGGGERKNVL